MHYKYYLRLSENSYTISNLYRSHDSKGAESFFKLNVYRLFSRFIGTLFRNESFKLENNSVQLNIWFK